MSNGNIASEQLRLFIERVERIDEEIKGLQDDRRDVLSEAKSQGFCATTIRSLIKRRKMETHDRQEADAMLETYEAALGMDEPVELPSINMEALELAQTILASEIEGLDNPAQAEMLCAYVARVLAERVEIKLIQETIKLIKKEVKDNGFDPLRMMDVVRWVEKCDKHGRDIMRATEATYHLYRRTVETGDIQPNVPEDQQKLLQKFATPAPEKPSASRTGAQSAAALADAARFAERASGISKDSA